MSPEFANDPNQSPLERAFDSPDTKRRYVKGMFATIAPRYDLITRLLSFGRDQHWKARLLTMAQLRPGATVLDLACGTGDLAFAASARQARVIGLDLTARMIELARERHSAAPGDIAWLVGDMTHLPFGAESVDVVTTGYGLRNVPDLPRALAEIHRVLRPGGRLCSLDFDRPESRLVRTIYLGYLNAVGAALGFVLHRQPDTYRYIPASIRRYPGARAVCSMMQSAGFTVATHVPIFGGFMAIHVAEK